MGKKLFLKWAGLVLAGVALAGCQNNPRSQWQPRNPGPAPTPGAIPTGAIPSNGLPPGGQPNNFGNMNAPTGVTKTSVPINAGNPIPNQPVINAPTGVTPLSGQGINPAPTNGIAGSSPVSQVSPAFNAPAPITPDRNLSSGPPMSPPIITPGAPQPVFQSRPTGDNGGNVVGETQYQPFSSTPPPAPPIPYSGSPVMQPQH